MGTMDEWGGWMDGWGDDIESRGTRCLHGMEG